MDNPNSIAFFKNVFYLIDVGCDSDTMQVIGSTPVVCELRRFWVLINANTFLAPLKSCFLSLQNANKMVI
jgi:hypothetical protein